MALGSNTKFYETPNHPYQGERIADESNLIGRYGLKNKEELWRAQSELRGYRREARKLLGSTEGDNREAEEFLARLKRYGILNEQDQLGDVLSLDVSDVLERRLQTVVYRKGYANTTEQARQFIVHGHIEMDGHRVTRPGMKVEAAVEDTISFDEHSSLSDDLHPERAEAQE